jgi:hypothetical protein
MIRRNGPPPRVPEISIDQRLGRQPADQLIMDFIGPAPHHRPHRPLRNQWRRDALTIFWAAPGAAIAALVILWALLRRSRYDPEIAVPALGMAGLVNIAVGSFVHSMALGARARAADPVLRAMQSGQFMIRWTYSTPVWRRWIARRGNGAVKLEPRLDLGFLWPAASAIIEFAVAIERGGRTAVALIVIGLISAAMSIAMIVIHLAASRGLRFRWRIRECYVASDAVYLDGRLLLFRPPNHRLLKAEYVHDDPAELRLHFTEPDGRSTLRSMPIPPRGRAAARRAAKRLSARARFENVGEGSAL